MKGFSDLVESERGVFCIMILIAVTLLAIVKVISGADWVNFTKWLTVTLVGSKTLTTAVDLWKNGQAQPVPPPTAQS